MGKRDPFAKGNDDHHSPMKDDMIDFGETKVMSTGNSNRTKIIAGVLVLGVLVGVGVYFMTMETEEPGIVLNDMNAAKKKNPSLPKMDKPALPPVAPPPPSMDMHADAPPAPPAPVTQPVDAKPMEHSEPTPKPEMAKDTSKAGPAKVLPPPPKALPAEDHGSPELAENSATENNPVATQEDESSMSVPVLSSPEDGASRNYDETANAATFTWSGGGRSRIRFSNSPKMRPVEVEAWVKNNSYKLLRPHPGTWYWQVSNKKGRSKIQSFVVNAPQKRAISLINVQDGATLSKDSALVQWKGDTMVTYYRIEVSNQGWANPSFRFATTGTQLDMRGVPQGQYQMRLGAFSEISGRWEYTDPLKVSVQ